MEIKSFVAATIIATSNLVTPVDVTDDDISGADTVIEESAPDIGDVAGSSNMRDSVDGFDMVMALLRDDGGLPEDEEEESKGTGPIQTEGGDGSQDTESTESAESTGNEESEESSESTNSTNRANSVNESEECAFDSEDEVNTVNNHIISGGGMDDVEVETMEATKAWITKTVNCRDIPDKSGTLIKTYKAGQQITVVGKVTKNPYNEAAYYQTDVGFIHAGYISFTEPVKEEVKPQTEQQQQTTQIASTVNVQLPVSNILQNPELPNGCEITSLTICLNYKGYAVDKCVMSDNYLPKWPDLSGDPEYYYLREPRSNGFYCFASCLCTTIDNYNAANGTSIQYKNLTGSSVSSLYAEIDAGNPVVVWGTLKWGNPRAYESGLYRNLHCMVLAGYTDTTVTIIDPIYGEKGKTVKRSTFESVWSKMGNRAMVVTQ